MKAWSILVLALLGYASCDQPPSSYAVLPYENEIHHPNQIIYETPHHYNDYDDYDSGKKSFNIMRIMKAPFKALKGVGNYMKFFFDDFHGNFNELKGSFFRAKGNLLEAKGENILQEVYSRRSKGNYYPIEPYHPPNPYHSPPYNPKTPVRVVPYGMENHHDLSNAIDPGHHGHDGGYQQGGHGGHVTHETHDAHSPHGSTYAEVPNHRRREFVEQRSARSFGKPFRTQRAYSALPPHIPHYGAIPVPVPIKVYPSKLIFPSVHGGGGGYH